MNRLISAFIAGARETNPKGEVSVSFINRAFAPPDAKRAACAMRIELRRHIGRVAELRRALPPGGDAPWRARALRHD